MGTSVSFDAKGDMLATVGNDRVLRLWNSQTGTLRSQTRQAAETRAVAWAKGDSRCAVCDDEGNINVFEVRGATGTFNHILVKAICEGEKLTAMAWHTSDESMAIGY